MRQTMKVSLIVFGILTSSAVSAELRHGDQAVIVTDTPSGTVNVRTIPVQRSGGDWGMGTRLGRAREGEMFKFLEKRDFGNQGVWVRLEQNDGSEAWVSGRYLTQLIARDRLIVRPTNVNIRRQASTGSEKIASVKKGQVLGRVRKQGTWYLAVLPDDKVNRSYNLNDRPRGWIREDMVTLEALAPEEAAPPKPAPEKPPEEPPKPEVDYQDVAQQAMDAGRNDEAAAAYEKALERDPKNGILHFDLAKLLVKMEKPEQAIPHLRKAISGRPARPEAEFTLKKLIEAREKANAPAGQADEGPEDVVGEDPDVIETGSPVLEFFAENAVYILPTAAVGSLAFIGVLVVLYRRRGIQTSQPSFRRRKADGGFDDVLKYAVEKRPVIREIEEAEKKLSEMDDALAKRFAQFQEKDEEGRPRLPPGESAERLLKRVEGLRKTILNQEERARIYSDLVMLQSEKINALDDEIDALKKLIQLDYQDTKKTQKRPASAPKPAPAKEPTPQAKPD